ncbi:ACT domain-containing protein ACR1-like isoform X2 [Phalaenopsis equestris]|uniref:ACT domain-containing protein ACR1-like isoform X2 n=1 Tax=Phalaenopsis equestris TaxID=78828 RepID=UPI0009E4D88C|nr:ACT domain-containing protein ACR1-like isoform X2 [Phalaenopsis equestris]
MAYFDRNFHTLEEVCVDNDTYGDRTVIKVSCVNRHGLLVDIVQALIDLDLIISKSYMSSDGDWIMDAFEVTDALGNKLIEPTQIRYIEESLSFAEGRGGPTRRPPEEVKTCLDNLAGAGHLASDHIMLEMTVGVDHSGISEVLATLLLDYHLEVDFCVAWMHNGLTGCILCIVDLELHISSNAARLAELEKQLRRVVGAHYCRGSSEKWRLRISRPSLVDGAHAERRLHQMMREENDWEGMGMAGGDLQSAVVVTAEEMEVSVNNVKKKDNYMVKVTVRSRDRPKLLFDVAFTLLDLNYDVVHASVSTEESIALQEYYIKKQDGRSRVTEMERERLIVCLVAAAERRPGPWGMRVKVRVVEYRDSLLWNITRVFRENGMLVVGAKWAKRGAFAGGLFYLKGGSSTGDVAHGLMQALRSEISGCNFEMKDGGGAGW